MKKQIRLRIKVHSIFYDILTSYSEDVDSIHHIREQLNYRIPRWLYLLKGLD